MQILTAHVKKKSFLKHGDSTAVKSTVKKSLYLVLVGATRVRACRMGWDVYVCKMGVCVAGTEATEK